MAWTKALIGTPAVNLNLELWQQMSLLRHLHVANVIIPPGRVHAHIIYSVLRVFMKVVCSEA